ncbi:MAG: NAD-dependent epimerase/dehydratase family protein [Muribaculaceae bacterium]|nr:NAD-dependent epimerase/dehydratase family protein [Muribaculaceae bacterium]
MALTPTLQRDLSDFTKSFPFEKELKGKSVLVTGATGLIGSLLIRALLELREKRGVDCRIVGVARNPEKVNALFGNQKVEWFANVNLEDGEFPDVENVDYIIHCASPTASAYFVTHPVETYLSTIEGTRSVMEYAVKRKVKSVVYLSSLEYYGVVNDDREIIENDLGVIDPYDVRSSYSLGKRVAESLCHAYWKEYGVPVKVARLTQVFGAGIMEHDNRVFAQFAKSSLKGEDIVLHTEGLSSKPYCYTIDALDAIFHILFKGEDGEAYNVANPDTYTSIREFAGMVQSEFNPGRDVVVELDSTRGYAPDTFLRLNVDKLKGLGWQPRHTLKEMMAKLLEYIKVDWSEANCK